MEAIASRLEAIATRSKDAISAFGKLLENLSLETVELGLLPVLLDNTLFTFVHHSRQNQTTLVD